MNRSIFSPAQTTYLDFVRAFASMIVLVGHSSMNFLSGSMLDKAHIQDQGVIIFFLISGFLISVSVLQKLHRADYGFGHYFTDRFCRIYTGYLPALVLVAIADYFLLRHMQLHPLSVSPERFDYLMSVKNIVETTNVQTWFGNLLMLQYFPVFQLLRVAGVEESVWFIRSYGSATPFWTINIEWWLYMAFGVLTFFFLRGNHPIRVLPLLLLGAVSFLPFYYAIGGMMNCLTLLWVLGVIASLLFFYVPEDHRLKPVMRKYFSILTIVFLVLTLGRVVGIMMDRPVFSPAEFQYGFYLAGTLFSLFFLLGFVQQVPGWLDRVVKFVAGYSFSLYLTHRTIVTGLYILFPGHDNDSGFFFLSILLSNLFAIPFWWLFERHHRTLAAMIKRRLPSPKL